MKNHHLQLKQFTFLLLKYLGGELLGVLRHRGRAIHLRATLTHHGVKGSAPPVLDDMMLIL